MSATLIVVSLGAVLDWCGDHRIPLPTDADLAWLAT